MVTVSRKRGDGARREDALDATSLAVIPGDRAARLINGRIGQRVGRRKEGDDDRVGESTRAKKNTPVASNRGVWVDRLVVLPENRRYLMNSISRYVGRGQS